MTVPFLEDIRILMRSGGIDVKNLGRARALRHALHAPSELSNEDFAHYAKEVSAAYFYIGNGEDHPPLHTSEYDFIDEYIKTGCNMFEMLANV